MPLQPTGALRRLRQLGLIDDNSSLTQIVLPRDENDILALEIVELKSGLFCLIRLTDMADKDADDVMEGEILYRVYCDQSGFRLLDEIHHSSISLPPQVAVKSSVQEYAAGELMAVLTESWQESYEG